MLKIADLSAYQPPKAPAGYDGIFVKATEGARYQSGVFGSQMSSASKVSKFQGPYHFARPEESSGQLQAERFIKYARPNSKHILWLDLEASRISQPATNQWARAWAREVRLLAPTNAVGLYLGAGYATNDTGHGLSEVFDLWWYPQYPSAYQLSLESEEFWRAMNRSQRTPERIPIASASSTWPTQFTPFVPKGNTTGWREPDLWQFTDHHGPGKFDASVSPLSVQAIISGGHATTEEEACWFLATSG